MKTILSHVASLLALASSLSLHAAGRDAAMTSPGVNASDWSSIRAAYEAARHGFFKGSDGTHTARNHGLGWQMCFDERGFTATPDAKHWAWGLELRGAAVGGQALLSDRQGDVNATMDASVDRMSCRGNTLSFQRDRLITEWFVNDGRGLEQGWTISQRPAGASAVEPVRLELAVRGTLKAEGEGSGVRFVSEEGSTVLHYDGLKAWDATGKTLPATMLGAGDRLCITVDQAGAQYPITIDPIAHMAYLKASNTEASDFFGHSVAVSGDTVVVGAPNEDSAATGMNGDQSSNGVSNSGAVYVFVRNGSSWSQQAYLKASNPGIGDTFGWSLALSGNTLVVGATGESSNATGINGNQADNSQISAGAVYVFVRSGSTWAQQAYLKASNTGGSDFFGSAVAISGEVIVVGAYGEDSAATGINGNQADNSASYAGAAYVFQRAGTVWAQRAYLKPSAINADDYFGFSVSMSGDTIVVGAYGEDSNATGVNGDATDNSLSSAGAAFVFARSGSTWAQQAYLKPFGNTDMFDLFGISVSVSGDILAVGASGEDGASGGIQGANSPGQADDSASAAGAAYIYERSAGVWALKAYLKANDPGASDEFGASVAVSGDTVAVGSPNEDSAATGVGWDDSDNSASNAGAVYLFQRKAYLSYWLESPRYLKASNTGMGDHFGKSVAISGDLLVVGAEDEASSDTGIDGNGTDNSATSAGASYLFNLGPVLSSVAKSGAAAPGNTDIAFSAFGQGTVGPSGDILFQTTLVGSGAPAGANSALFSTVGGSSVDLALQAGSSVGGMMSLPANARITSVGNPVQSSTGGPGIFQATVNGTAITSTNNRLILRDNGLTVSPIARTGLPIASLGGAVPSSFGDVVQAAGMNDFLAVRYSLKTGVATTTTGNDTGLFLMNHDGSVLVTSAREGSNAYSGGKFGQFVRQGVAGQWLNFVAKYIPTVGASADALYYVSASGTGGRYSAYAQGITPPGALVATEKFSSFTGITARDNKFLVRALVSGAVTAKNEGVWDETNGMILRKGETQIDSTRTVSSITRVWGTPTQMVALVTLSGSGVTALNNRALVLRKASGGYATLMRTGDVAPGLGNHKVTLGTIQAVDVDPVNGHYVVLATLRGMPASANQALFSGSTTTGSDGSGSYQRLPNLRLLKGNLYSTSATPKGKIAGIAIKPVLDPSGVGGRGQGQIISSTGDILVEITGDRKVKELVKLTP